MKIIDMDPAKYGQKQQKVIYRLELENALKRLGIYPDQMGFRLLVMAAQLWLDYIGVLQESLPPQVTKTIYPEIAKITGRTVYSVERNMRYSIQRAMDNPEKREYICKCFGCEPEPGRTYFTVSQFIALLVNQIYFYGGVGPAA